MEIADLPSRVRCLQALRQPLQLLRIHVRAIQREKFHGAVLEVVVALLSHMKWLVKTLVGTVVITEGRIEFHSGVEQRFVRLFELPLEIGGALVAIQVVAQHEH